ncbi:Uma2 family endonuclease [Actinoplanes rectilineatus]|uniref:Uma2 family endonuclease n=1 Tax=Actinoplanes rectilineatus TaxID=113571 RepID=UPI003CCBB17C
MVVEVADETLLHDLNVKTRLYGSAGYPVYWVVTREQIFEHTEPIATGYRRRVEYRPGDRIPVTYAGIDVLVDDLLPTP